MTKIKICGIRDSQSLETCITENVDWIGFNFSPRSKRRISLDDYNILTQDLSSSLKGKRVFVFFQNDPSEIRSILQRSKPDYMQFVWGDIKEAVPIELSYTFSIPYIWQIGIREPIQNIPHCIFPIFDAPSEQGGGSGETFSWELLDGFPGKYVLAGGLNAENVQVAIQKYHPWGVDVASGVESEPGKKDPNKIKEFVQNVRSQ